jgi:hypothetical protein
MTTYKKWIFTHYSAIYYTIYLTKFLYKRSIFNQLSTINQIVFYTDYAEERL